MNMYKVKSTKKTPELAHPWNFKILMPQSVANANVL